MPYTRLLILVPEGDLAAVRRAVEQVNPGGGAGFGTPLLLPSDAENRPARAHAACWQMTPVEAAAFQAALAAEGASAGVRLLPVGHPDPERALRHPSRMLADEGWRVRGPSPGEI